MIFVLDINFESQDLFLEIPNFNQLLKKIYLRERTSGFENEKLPMTVDF